MFLKKTSNFQERTKNILPEKAVKWKKPTSGKPACGRRFLAESVGFEPTCPVKDNCISSAARYDRFDNSPCHICNISLKKTSGKRRELMERTKVISVVNNTAKAPKNQGFLEKWFQSGHSFSSAARYDRFDNSPYHPCNISPQSLWKTFGKRGNLIRSSPTALLF